MTFRLRVLALILFVATTASGATAWLTLRQASRQLRESAAADRADVTRIRDALRDYGVTHATWHGVDGTVRDLAATTGQRVRLVAEPGDVVADSDELAGRPPRPVPRAAVAIDARPLLRLPDGAGDTLLVRLTVLAIGRYRSGARYAACLTREGTPVAATPGELGVPSYDAGGPTACRPAPPAADDARADSAEARACLPEGPRLRACLGEVFARRVRAVAPPPLDVYVGALDEAPARLAVGPAAVAAAVVALVVVGGGLLLSRRVLRPVRELTAAAQAVGAGDLSRRVPAEGRDELAELGRSFNRMADSLAESEERQRRLVNDVAHELRTPLANLRGYLEALRDGVVPGSPELVESLHEEVLLQQRIVDDLQDLALAEAGRLRYHLTDVDLADVVATTVAAHRQAAAAGGVTLTADAPPVAVRGDFDRLRQLLANLVTNAVRATPPGGSVSVTLRAAGGVATLDVADTGTGIDAGDLPYVFDRFWRADAARGRTTGGSGLGLAIARQIARDHGGSIAVHSAAGAGTTFTVTIPARD